MITEIDFDIMLSDFGTTAIYRHYQSSVLNPLTGAYTLVYQDYPINCIFTHNTNHEYNISSDTQVLNDFYCWFKPDVSIELAKGDIILYLTKEYIVKTYTKYLDVAKIVLEKAYKK